MKKFVIPLLLVLFLYFPVPAQKPEVYSSADIAQMLQRLQVLGNVLYLAAHPDDENTRLITFLNNEKKYRTAYLSLTRGDGGQNLIGPEIREKLGIIRTQELLKARSVDGGEQFFSRANDFGYSKHPDETFATWDREKVLGDVVYVIRTFKPDVIITRFNTEPGTTHGHHTASAILAEEAFEAAKDPSRFPEQLAFTETWQTERLLWNTSSWFFQNKEDFDTSGLIKIDVGIYNPLLGKSYTEIAAESRSMHKSQGFGTALQRGAAPEYLQPVKGSVPENNLFEGINTSWSRVKGGETAGEKIKAIVASFRPDNPSAIVPELLQLYRVIESLPENPYKQQKLSEVKEIVKACLGLYLEVNASESNASPGDSVLLVLEAINRSPVPVKLQQITIVNTAETILYRKELKENIKFPEQILIKLPDSVSLSQPYWLKEPPEKGMFRLDNKKNTGKAENDPAIKTIVSLLIDDQELEYELPVTFKYTEPSEGEIYQPFAIVPPVAVNVRTDKLLFTGNENRTLAVEVVAWKDSVQGNISLDMPAGWKAEPSEFPYAFNVKGESKICHFLVSAPKKPDEKDAGVVVTYGNKKYNRGLEFIRYSHIPAQVYLPQARVKLVKMELSRQGKRIGYLMGAGDEVPESLRLVGYQVDILRASDLEKLKLKDYDAVVVGVRAFNTLPELKFRKKALEQYAREGGTVVIQYNTSFGLVDEDIAPYNLQLSRKRVTDEEAPVSILAPDHQVFNKPNKITAKDFEGWVQERGLYFAESWDREWTPLIASHDRGEESLEGGLLVAKVGRGYYVYTGYSWFRQLPAGVPGAYKIFVNLLSLGK